METCDSFIIHSSFISPPQCQCSSVSSILEANKWNSLVMFVITPSAVHALRPWSVMVLERAPPNDWLFQQPHTLASSFQSSPLFYSRQPWQSQCNIQRKYCFHTISLRTHCTHTFAKNSYVLTKTLDYLIGLNSLSIVYVHNTLTNVHLEWRKLDEHSAYVHTAYTAFTLSLTHTHRYTIIGKDSSFLFVFFILLHSNRSLILEIFFCSLF